MLFHIHPAFHLPLPLPLPLPLSLPPPLPPAPSHHFLRLYSPRLPSRASITPSPSRLTRVCVGAAGTALALLLTAPPHLPFLPSHPLHLAPALADPTTATATPPLVFPATLTTDAKKALRVQSQRNTRAAGRTSQLFSLARRQAASGDLDAALSTYDDIIAAAPTFAPAYSNRGNILSSRRLLDAAVRDYDTALTLAPLDGDAWVVWTNRGCTRLARGDAPREALQDLNVAAELNGGSEIVLANRAAVYEVLGKWDSAIRDYQTALRSNDVQPFWCRYGLVLFQRNRGAEAVGVLKRVGGRFDVADVHAALAAIYFEGGDLAAAETEWSQVDRPRLFESKSFLEGERKWPPRAVEAMQKFRHLKQ